VKSRIAAPWAEQIDESRLELISGSFVTKDFKDKETDIVYRADIAGTDVIFYILLELQSKVDITMPFRLHVYMVELLRRLFANSGKKIRKTKGFRLPAIVPIVLYNGASEWSCVKSFKEYLAGYELFVPNVIDFEYILINVNETNEAELLANPTLMNLVMLTDQKCDFGNMIRRLGRVLEICRRLTEEEQIQLKDWITDVFFKKTKDKLGRKDKENILKIFEKEETDMTYALETVLDEALKRSERKGRREGKREGMREGKREGMREGERRLKSEAAKAMIEDGIPLENISKYLGISASELKKYSVSSEN
jgi:predicted transposase/invertase (TIGR01784 family)